MADKKGVFLFESFFRILEQLPAQEAVRIIEAFMNVAVNGEDIPESLSPLSATIVQAMVEQDCDDKDRKSAHSDRMAEWRRKKKAVEGECDSHTASQDTSVTSQNVTVTTCDITKCHVTNCDSHKTSQPSPSSAPLSPPSLLPPTPPNNTPPLIPPLSPPSLSLVRDRSREPAGAQPPAPLERDRAERDANVADGFEVFWALYPRKQRRAQALKQWNRIADTTETADDICQAVIRWTESRQWTQEGNRFVPLPENFLSKRIWMDEPDAPGALGATPGAPGKSGAPDASGTLDRPPNSFNTQEFFDCAVERACGKDGTG